MSEIIFLMLLFGLPGALGCYLARRRGKNPFIWGLLSAIFPFFLLVLYMQYKPKGKDDGASAGK